MSHSRIVATFPSDDHTLTVLFASSDDAARADDAGLQLLSGRPAEPHGHNPDSPTEIRLGVEAPPDEELVVDQVVVGSRLVGPRFVHGVKSPMELKVPHTEPRFPYGSTLAGVHASVACCTGCDGGIHDRGLVVLNNHTGGSWSGIWVRSDIDMPSAYARWQKVAFLGGVLRDDSGSTTVHDEGWMRVRLTGEEPHDAPTPTRVSAADFPAKGTRSLLARSLEASWVELADARVIDARRVDPGTENSGGVRLPRMKVRLTDDSAAESVAWLYQESAFDLTSGARIARLRGFLHAEAPGLYILLGDKEEDLLIDEIMEVSEEKIRQLLDERPSVTRTYRVSREVLQRLPIDRDRRLRTMDDDETTELAEYLGVEAGDLDGRSRVVDIRCSHCGRHLTFLDFVKTAVERGPHDLTQLREVLSGRNGAWLTVRGRDGGRPVACARCGTTLVRPDGYSEYSSSSYAYA